MGAYVHTYEERKGESKLHVFCSCLSTGLIMFHVKQVQIDCMHFSVLSITQDERRGGDENFITFGVLDSRESPCLSRESSTPMG